MNIVLINTPYHAVKTNFLINKDIIKKPLILIVCPHEHLGKIETLIDGNSSHHHIPWEKGIISRLLSLKQINQTIRRLDHNIEAFIYNDLHPLNVCLLRKKLNSVTLVEEGIGLYRSNPSSDVKKYLKILANLFAYPTSTAPKMGHASQVEKIVCFNPENLDEIQQKKTITKICGHEFKRYLQNLRVRFSFKEGSCIFIGQPLIEDKVISKKAFTRILRKTLDTLQKRYEYIYYKPHPREAKSNLSDLPIDSFLQDIPFELIEAEDYIPPLFTFYSSSIINSQLDSKKTLLFKCFPEFSKIEVPQIENSLSPTNLSEI
ncbi:glycosyltransferase family 52 [Pseudomonas citronellolis]|uniref:glycosyltransferase family 52 n=1 Tax=Pseudomonas citronellolis TaxID=53408 RepID=UPI00248E8F4F|nr:glycosyltransferase family 52 [Pseudomonas citronellolis]